MKVETTVLEVNTYLHKAVKYCRLKMIFGCKLQTVKRGLFSKSYKEVPYEDDFDYWQNCMVKTYPWNQMNGVWNVLTLAPQTKIILDCDAMGKILAYSNLYDKMVSGNEN